MPERFAMFDVDHTITRASTGRRLIQHGWKAGLFSIRNVLMIPYLYFRYRYGTIRIDRLAARMGVLVGSTKEQLNEVSERCYVEKVHDDIMPGALELLHRHEAAGDTVVLATSSLALIVRPLARELGIEHVLCTEMEFRDGVATGGFLSAPCYGEEKKRRVTEFVNARGGSLQDVTFYSDSRADLPLLMAVGKAVAVNPDHALKRAADRHGWTTLRIN